MPNILYLFITHQKKLQIAKKRINSMMNNLQCSDYLIISGSNKSELFIDEKILFINCNDNYDGLPEKVIKMFSFLINNNNFNKYTHFCKLDEDMIVNELINYDEIKNFDYCGNVNRNKNGNRKWHIGRCSPHSKFNNTPYNGVYVDWCMGGYGYIASRIALNNINNDNNYDEHIYEDLYIAILLKDKNIIPENFYIKKYIFSPEHK
jgi:hypothetical protein